MLYFRKQCKKVSGQIGKNQSTGKLKKQKIGTGKRLKKNQDFPVPVSLPKKGSRCEKKEKKIRCEKVFEMLDKSYECEWCGYKNAYQKSYRHTEQFRMKPLNSK